MVLNIYIDIKRSAHTKFLLIKLGLLMERLFQLYLVKGLLMQLLSLTVKFNC